jgi:hypothetical protein
MCTLLVARPLSPRKGIAYVDRRLTPVTHVIQGLVPRCSVRQSELESFIRVHGLGPSGRTEYFDGTKDDGWIEFHRTVLGVGTPEYFLHDASVLAGDIERHFKEVTVTLI